MAWSELRVPDGVFVEGTDESRCKASTSDEDQASHYIC